MAYGYVWADPGADSREELRIEDLMALVDEIDELG